MQLNTLQYLTQPPGGRTHIGLTPERATKTAMLQTDTIKMGDLCPIIYMCVCVWCMYVCVLTLCSKLLQMFQCNILIPGTICQAVIDDRVLWKKENQSAEGEHPHC